MSSQRFVLNEWILHDLRGDNGPKAQLESFRFLKRLKEKCDRIAALKGSRWMQKAYDLMKSADPPIRTVSKYLHLVILRDPEKCEFVGPDEIKPVSEDLGTIPQEDLYLVQICYSTQADALVTTDERLVQSMPSTNVDVIVRRRDEFLKEYLEAG